MDDRREFFRINDNVSLKYRVVQNEDIEAEIRRTEHEQNDMAELKNAFNVIEARILGRLERLHKTEPLVAEILGLFDKKMSLMQNMLMQGDDIAELTANMQPVNLSASGMSFESHTPLNEGTNLKMEMVLFPEYHFIPLYARVIDCFKKIDDSLYRFQVRVEFVGISNRVQEDIMQHVLNKQAADLQQTRQKPADKTAING